MAAAPPRLPGPLPARAACRRHPPDCGRLVADTAGSSADRPRRNSGLPAEPSGEDPGCRSRHVRRHQQPTTHASRPGRVRRPPRRLPQRALRAQPGGAARLSRDAPPPLDWRLDRRLFRPEHEHRRRPAPPHLGRNELRPQRAGIGGIRDDDDAERAARVDADRRQHIALFHLLGVGGEQPRRGERCPRHELLDELPRRTGRMRGGIARDRAPQQPTAAGLLAPRRGHPDAARRARQPRDQRALPVAL